MSNKQIGVRCFRQGSAGPAGVSAVVEDYSRFLYTFKNTDIEDAVYTFVYDDDGPEGSGFYRDGVAYVRIYPIVQPIPGLNIDYQGRTTIIMSEPEDDDDIGMPIGEEFHPYYGTGSTIEVVVGSNLDPNVYSIEQIVGGIVMEYKLEWDKTGEHYYENGVSHGVLYPQKADGTYDNGVAWSGLTNVTKSPEGAEPNDLWADNIKYASLRSAETFSGNIEAYTYPPEYRKCIGLAEAVKGVYFGQQAHEPFGFCFRTEIGNDTPSEGDDAFKIHIVYGATASPSEESYDTINDSPDATPFSWDFDTIPVVVPGYKPVSCIVIDSRYAEAAKMTALLDILYGKGSTEARLPMPDEIKTLMANA